MQEKLMDTKQQQPELKKKVYTPPALTTYGKLTELTAGGSFNQSEPMGGPNAGDTSKSRL